MVLSIQKSKNFCDEVIRRCGDNFRRCLHCLSCAGGCPVNHAMTYRPNGIFRLIQFGMQKEVLESSDIWLCLGCNTCTIACPMAIDIAAVINSLREIAIEKKVPIAEPDILNFHQEVLNSIQRHGRTHKLEIMLLYKLRRWDFFSDMNIGLKMLAKRKLDLLPSTIADPGLLNELLTQGKGLEDGHPATD
ncbi:MAG: 4Fe-4S dicluster domain-containing protein [Thermodesulfobacteriota bacterium]